MGWTTGRPRCTGCVVGALWFDAGMVSTGGEDALKRARTALASGRLTLARDILEDHVHLHRDAEAFKMLGEIRHRIGDLPGAGAAWFATSAKGPIVDEAVSAWRTKHDDDFAAMWATIPASARRGELTPKLAALKARAEVSAPSPEPSPSLSPSPDPSPAPASTARAKAQKKVAPEPAATAPPVAVSSGVSYELIDRWDVDKLNHILTVDSPEFFSSDVAYTPAVNAVRLYRVTYPSVVPEKGNKPIMASGLLAVPETDATRFPPRKALPSRSSAAKRFASSAAKTVRSFCMRV